MDSIGGLGLGDFGRGGDCSHYYLAVPSGLLEGQMNMVRVLDGPLLRMLTCVSQTLIVRFSF